MGLMGMKQKAEMTAEGFSPEQAQMASEQPTPEMQQEQAFGEQEAEGVRRLHAVGQADKEQNEESAAQAQQMEEMKMAPPPLDPNEEPRHAREKEKMDLEEKGAQSAHGREKEKMTLQEQISQQQHKRAMEQMKMKAKESAKKPPPKKGTKK